MEAVTRLGVVGNEAAKFTPHTEQLARQAIRDLIVKHMPSKVVSGGCHLGGIDIWAVEEARRLSIDTVEFKPEVLAWDPPRGRGFKARNISIANYSTIVACVVVRTLPPEYAGRRFNLCYHCKKHGGDTNHIKSGGCWTAWLCPQREWVVIG